MRASLSLRLNALTAPCTTRLRTLLDYEGPLSRDGRHTTPMRHTTEATDRVRSKAKIKDNQEGTMELGLVSTAAANGQRNPGK